MALLVGVLLAGCGGEATEGSCLTRESDPPPERTVAVAHRGPDQDPDAVMEEPVPRLVVQVTNSQPQSERLRLAFDGRTALDVDLPRSEGCGSGGAVFSVGYDVEPGPIDIELDVQGEATTTTVEVPDRGTIWAVVDVQSEREWAEIQTFDDRPGWG